MKEKYKNTIKSFIQSSKPGLSVKQEAMIANIIELVDMEATDIMTPRIDVISFEIGERIIDILPIIQKYGFSRYPVWEDNIDNIIGVLYVKDILYYIANIYSSNVLDISKLTIEESLLRAPFFIPETKNLESLLINFQQHKVHIAQVVDEYGGFSGLVSLEDVIEAIAGDIQDEYDQEEEEIYKVSPHVFIVNGKASLTDIEKNIGISFPEHIDEIDSIGGLLYSLFSNLTTGSRVEYKGVYYQIMKLENNKIISIKILLRNKKK